MASIAQANLERGTGKSTLADKTSQREEASAISSLGRESRDSGPGHRSTRTLGRKGRGVPGLSHSPANGAAAAAHQGHAQPASVQSRLRPTSRSGWAGSLILRPYRRFGSRQRGRCEPKELRRHNGWRWVVEQMIHQHRISGRRALPIPDGGQDKASRPSEPSSLTSGDMVFQHGGQLRHCLICEARLTSIRRRSST